MSNEYLMKLGAPRFRVGDPVIYTNPYGVCWGERIVSGHEIWTGENYADHRYYLTPCDTPWYPVSQACLEAAVVISHMRGLDLRVSYVQATLQRKFDPEAANEAMCFLCVDVMALGRSDYDAGHYDPPLMFKGESDLLRWWEDGQADAAKSADIRDCSSCHDESGDPCPIHG